MMPSCALLKPGEIIDGKYSITRMVGSGGMAVVYEAVHMRLAQRVALKILLPELSRVGDVVLRFQREARAAAQLRSLHAARVFDADKLPDGTPYIVMEFLDGHDLATVLAARGSLPVGEAVAYVMQACHAMAEAHRLGPVHRDLKPSNPFLVQEGHQTIVQVVDFAVSKVADDGLVSSITRIDAALGAAL